MDSEVRRLRESPLGSVPADAIRVVLEGCVKQQHQYQARRTSGSMLSSWLATPRVSMAGCAGNSSSMHGATSLAGPLLDTGHADIGRLSPVLEAV